MMNKNNNNLRKNSFKEEELKQYVKNGDLKESDIQIILEYQKLLPVLQQEDGSWIDARTLHKELKVGKVFGAWIAGRIDKYEFIENEDYKVCFPKRESKKGSGGHNTKDYSLTLDMAKELSMVENNKIGRISRKYFIAIDKAFKARRLWNIDRWETLEHYKNYRKIINLSKKELMPTMPDWCKKRGDQGVFMGEANLLNEIIIGMSASDYRFKYCLPKDEPVRNHFNNFELQMVAELEKFDTDLIRLQEMYDYEERRKLLAKKYQSLLDNNNF
ncbi:antA/AntB antirepressor family protein [Roseburia sp. 1XD42-69]|uniref:antA/AntB antirepressor family protein n=1 Tax=Roseburia sp. 1XD42-69 TaxID=2320088 RepID=UPI0018F6A593|nr:antA/AntB antirepressor family protein [Roseburia sp. 1XD42-69]